MLLILIHSISMCSDSDSDSSALSTTAYYGYYSHRGDFKKNIKDYFEPDVFEAIKTEKNAIYFYCLNTTQCQIYDDQLRTRSKVHGLLPEEFAIACNNTGFIEWLGTRRWSPLRQAWGSSVIRAGLHTRFQVQGPFCYSIDLGRFVDGTPDIGKPSDCESELK